MNNRFFFFASAMLTFISSFGQTIRNVEISAVDYPRKDEIITLHLPKPVESGRNFELINIKTKKTFPVQWRDSETLVFICLDSIPPNRSQVLQLSNSNIKQSEYPVSIDKDENGLLVKSHNKSIFFYHTKTVMPPSDSPAYYQKSGFIHPLYSPNQKILTDDFPSSHAHQHGIFNAWTNTTFRKEFVDFWNQALQKGTVAHAETVSITTGPVFAQLKIRLSHRSSSFGEVLVEYWTITIYPFSNYFVFDLLTEQRNLTKDTLFLNKYHYGGMAFRGTKVWDPYNKSAFQNNWQILTSEGARDSLANHTHVRWVDASGLIDGKLEGVTVFNHPKNFRFPQAIRVHPTMPYWVYSPVVDDAFYLAPASVYRARYRYFVHEGGPDVDMIERIWKNWEKED